MTPTFPLPSLPLGSRSFSDSRFFLLTRSLTCDIAGQVKPFLQPLTWLVFVSCCVDSISILYELVNTMVTFLITLTLCSCPDWFY